MHADAHHLLVPADSPPAPLWQNRLGLLLESTGEGVFGVDLDGHCMFINRAGAHMLGFEPADVLGHNMHQLVHHSRADGSHYPDADCPIFGAFRQGLPCRVDSEVFWRRDRTAFAVEYSSHPIIDAGQIRGAVITFVDITERKRAADTLASLLAALRIDIHWLQKRLAEPPAADGETAHALRERMRCKCQNMGRLVGRAANSLGHLIADSRPGLLDHQDLWAALKAHAHDFAKATQLELEWDMQPEGAPQLAKPAGRAVLRIFQEMLSNVGRHAQASRLAVRIAVDQERLRLTVEDNGNGASPDAFEAAGSYGVTAMRERARDFGGHIAISSEVGHGCAFTLVLPHPQGAIA